jgi:LysM repeat protein
LFHAAEIKPTKGRLRQEKLCGGADLRLNRHMRRRSLLLLSAGLNVVLAAGWYWSRPAAEPARALRTYDTNPLAATPERLRVVPVYRKQFFLWPQLESTNYDTYIRNLRAIDCPEPTIRDIIVADVNAAFRRRNLEVPAGLTAQWWQADGFTNLEAAISQQRDQLDKERRTLLDRLLGPGWENSNGTRTAGELQFDGPVLGAVSDSARQSVRAIIDQQQATIESLYANGKPVSAADLVQVERNTFAALAGVLTPTQLEEFALRYSQNAGDLRNRLADLKYFNVTPDEFRNLFRATDAVNYQLRALGDREDAASQQQQQALRQQLEAAIQTALGPQRYAEYTRLQDPDYQAALDQARAAGGGSNMLSTLYAINQAVTAEQARIDANTNLSDLQKQIEQKKVELAQLQAQSQAAGETVAADNAPPLPQPQPAATLTTQPHVVQPGENMIGLAHAFGTGVNDIIAVNPGVDFHSLKPGDTINVPIVQPNPAP